MRIVKKKFVAMKLNSLFYFNLLLLFYNLYLEVSCSDDQLNSCVIRQTNTSGVITSPNFPHYYPRHMSCWWHITPAESKHIELDFIILDLATRDKRAGRCHDSLTIYHPQKTVIVSEKTTNTQSSSKQLQQRLYPKKIISKGAISMHLQTCFNSTNSSNRYQGFYSTFKESQCPGCGIGDSVCGEIYKCDTNCGRILSINYPLNYLNNHRCQWLITSPLEFYVNLTVDDFDVPDSKLSSSSSECTFDHVSFTDYATNTLIGRYCNSRKPPKHILSKWNQLLIEFNTDSTLSGRGFSFTYHSQQFELKPQLSALMVTPMGACPENWSYFRGHCYNAFFEKESLQWYQSEERCAQEGKGRDGHLVSIVDQHEMHVIHYLLINRWKVKPHQSIYIGLIDTNREGFYNWSDGNPMSYTDWSRGNGDVVTPQPDGGAYEDCTVIKIDSSHTTANWHDIPCSLGRFTLPQSSLKNNTATTFSDLINGFICKMISSESSHQHKPKQPLYKENYIGVNEEEEENFRHIPFVDERYFVCENLEIISNLFRCDGLTDCRDNSDETVGCPNSFNTCLESQYRCENGRCISIGMYCDFIDNCGDGSEEKNCDRRQCKLSEFECNNQQCISLTKRCDLLYDCKDQSDEGITCYTGGHCNINSTFQCYYGNCIPLYALCDRHIDCPGKFSEDEQESKCQKHVLIDKKPFTETSILSAKHNWNSISGKQKWNSKVISEQVEKVWERYERSACIKTIRRTCQDLYIHDAISTNGTYFIQPGGESSIGMTIECIFVNGIARTIVHHDTESKLYVSSDIVGSTMYSRTITYQYSLEPIVNLINSSHSCRQLISWQYIDLDFDVRRNVSTKPMSWWVSRQGIRQNIWEEMIFRKCGFYSNCTQDIVECNTTCELEIKFSINESNYIQDKDKLPVTALMFGETYESGNSGYFFVGPLECEGNISEDEEFNKCPVSLYDKPDFKCQSGHIIEAKYRCIYEFDQFSYQIGCRDVSHLRDCESYQCPADYVKCPNSYCIPPRYICNGKWDCIGGSDEIECTEFRCPGQYRCANDSSCVLQHQLCDGIRHCPHGDDEWLCDLKCPENCTSIGLYINCKNASLIRLPIEKIPRETRKLDLTNNLLGPDLEFADFSGFGDMGELILQRNGIEVIKLHKFLQLRNLYKLDLRFNNLIRLESGAFAGLTKVIDLQLDHNPNLRYIEPRAFVGLSSLRELNISSTNIEILPQDVFVIERSSLQVLTFQNNHLRAIEKGAFKEMTSLVSMDIRGNEIVQFPADMFNGLKALRTLYTDSFKFCCLAANIKLVPFERCWPPPDEISSCEDLMSNIVQRGVLWVLGIVALIGNASVIVWRFRTRYINPVSSTLILSLGCADFLMGVYLIIIASVDVHYRGHYIENADYWVNSVLCKFCGFCSTISSEVSVATLVFIAIDRLICICFPFSLHKFTLKLTHRIIAASWIIVFLLAALPLFPIPYFNDEYYSRSGVCLALHITSHKHSGWEYSVFIFLCINLTAFLIIFCCYCYMYKTIQLSARKMNRLKARQVRETQVGRQMALIVITNCLCWCPVIAMGLLVITGFKIPGAAYSWTAVFVIPLNSATNPIIYTLAQFKPYHINKRDSITSRALFLAPRASQGRAITEYHSISTASMRQIKTPPGYVPLIEFLRIFEDLQPTHLLQISQSIAEQMKDTHDSGFALGGINFDNVFISTRVDSEKIRAYLPDYNSYRVNNYIEIDDYAVDVEEFGLIVKRMLRIYHMRKNAALNDERRSLINLT